jgi:hypothetical protein
MECKKQITWDEKIQNLVQRIESETWHKKEFDNRKWQFTTYKFYVSHLKVEFANTLPTQACFVVAGQNIRCESIYKIKTFNDVIAYFMFYVKRYLKKENKHTRRIYKIFNQSICDRGEKWVKRYGL